MAPKIDSAVGGETVEVLKRQRVGLQAASRGYHSSLSTYTALESLEDLRAKILIMEGMVQKLEDNEAKLLAFIPENDLQDFIVENGEVVCQVNFVIEKLKTRIQQLGMASGSSSSTACPAKLSGANLKLEKIKIEKFSGDFLKFQEFWDRFRVRYHENPAINKIDRFEYLVQSLDGEAARCLASLPATEDNYEHAIEILQRRYGRKVPRINAHVTAILKLPKCSDGDSVWSLRQVSDEMVAHVRSLKAMGALEKDSEEVSAILGPILFSRLPDSMCQKWYEKNKDDGLKVDALIDFVESQIEGKELSALARGEYELPGRCSDLKSSHPGNQGKLRSSEAYHGGAVKGKSLERSPGSGSQRTRLDMRSPSSRMDGKSGDGRSSASFMSSKVRPGCPFCDEQHYPGKCEKALGMPVKKRHEAVKRSGRCFKCLNLNHCVRFCGSSGGCASCGGSHHKLLCFRGEKAATVSCVKGVGSSGQAARVLLQTVVARVNGRNSSHLIRVLLDPGSQYSFVVNDIAEALQLKPSHWERLSVETFGGGKTGVQKTPVYRFDIFDSSGKQRIEVVAYGTRVIGNQRQPLVENIDTKRYPHLRGINFSDTNEQLRNVSIGLLLGADYYHQVVNGKTCRGGSRDPVALETRFGWALTGPIMDSSVSTRRRNISVNCHRVSVHFVSTEHKIEEVMGNFFKLESYGVSEKEFQTEDQLVHQQFKESIRYVGDRYEVKLPWRESHPPLLDNKRTANKRLESLVHRLDGDAHLKAQYHAALKEFEQLHFIEEVPGEASTGHPVYYLPHHPVLKETSKTTKCRPVFAANTRGPNGVSLNDCLHIGPALSPEVPDVLLRFRMHRVAISSDIQKAFLQVQLHPDDRDACRILWVGDGGGARVLRFRVVSFGISSAPFLLNATIRHHLEQEAPTDLIRELKENFYIDNLLFGGKDVREAETKGVSAFEIMRKAGMNLCQWTSNSERCLQWLKQKGLDVSEDPLTGVLGLEWDTVQDYLFVTPVQLKDPKLVTKRHVASLVAKLYDPLGFVAPILVRGKILLQKLWLSKLGWDEPIGDSSFLREFREFQEEAGKVGNVQIPRFCLASDVTSASSLSLHVFCDSSRVAGVAAVYLRQSCGDASQAHLIVCKTKVVPMKMVDVGYDELTIAKLELVACLLGAKLLNRVVSALHLEDCEVFLWTDSQIALAWICGHEQKGPVFIRNRVRDILCRTKLSSWGYVPSKENPADLPSRGMVRVDDLKSSEMWLHGPSWLCKERACWPSLFPIEYPASHRDVFINLVKVDEVKPTNAQINQTLIDLHRFSSLGRAVSVVAWLMRFVHNARTTREHKMKGPIVAEELEKSRRFLIMMEQRKHFSDEISACQESLFEKLKRSSLKSLNPKWSASEQLLLSVGRERPQMPLILMPRDSHLSVLLLREAHAAGFHCGPEQTLAGTRLHYWIVNGRRIAKRVVNDCRICLRYRATSYAQVESALPKVRTFQNKPFAVIGMDFAGPLYTSDGGKCYICLITCAVTRAVHLELLENLTTAVFIQGFRRFVARRGKVDVVICDNALTFKKASLSFKEIEWRFIPERSPWWGGFYERLVKAVKDPLRKTLGRSLLPFRELETILIEIESVLNSRPLTLVSDRREDEPPLTPGNFLSPSLGSCPLERLRSDGGGMLRMWRRRQSLLANWWKRWSREYLATLHRWHRSRSAEVQFPSKGDIVLVESEGRPRIRWPLGRIEELIVGMDGVPRAAFIRVGKSLIRRPTQKLIPLELVPRVDDDPPPLEGPLALEPRGDLEDPEVQRLALEPRGDLEDPEVQHLANRGDLAAVRTRGGRTVKVPTRYRDFELQ